MSADDGQGKGSGAVLRVLVPPAPHLPVGFVDRLKHLREAGSFIDRPKAIEVGPEQADVPLGQKAHGNYSFT